MLLFNMIIQSQIIMLKYFNTSNVTIQRISKTGLEKIGEYFNTSNITIQRYIAVYRQPSIFISIHLMLLFNKIDTAGVNGVCPFQYI